MKSTTRLDFDPLPQTNIKYPKKIPTMTWKNIYKIGRTKLKKTKKEKKKTLIHAEGPVSLKNKGETKRVRATETKWELRDPFGSLLRNFKKKWADIFTPHFLFWRLRLIDWPYNPPSFFSQKKKLFGNFFSYYPILVGPHKPSFPRSTPFFLPEWKKKPSRERKVVSP